MEYLFVLLPAAMLLPLYGIYRRKAAGGKVRSALAAQITAFFTVCVLTCVLGVGSVMASADVEAAGAAQAGGAAASAGLGMLSAAISTGLSCLGAGFAVAAAASAAMGAISEKESTFGKALIFVALAEGVALYSFLISFLILGKF